MAVKDRTFDTRTLETHLRDGIVTREEYEKHLEALPDVAEKGESMDAEFVAGVLDEEQETAKEETDEEE